ncbi:MAG: metallophosphoesterase [Selenomonadaceae bacterium]|nr:metallophosphoesterase [Selenomonadaceae bacterium]
MNYRRILAIGDIHGKFSKLMSLIHKVNFDETKDFLILLGDYIDRGEDNIRCLRWAMEMSRKNNVVALRGNHEQMMLNYYLSDGAEFIWLPNGGNKTKKELEVWQLRSPDALKRAFTFINERPYYHHMFIDDEEYIFVHAGLKPNVPLAEQNEESLLWIREKFYNGYNGSANIVCGHTPTSFIEDNCYYPILLPNKITLMDTGSFLPDGKISCIDVLTKTVWQSD